MKTMQNGEFFGVQDKILALENFTFTYTTYTHEKVDWHRHENAYFTFLMVGKMAEISFGKYMAIPDRAEEYYGYLLWNKTFKVAGREVESYYCAGNGGNTIFVFPEEDLVVVITATAYNMPYAHPQANEIMEKHVLPAVLGE